jgi:hypothetical protein
MSGKYNVKTLRPCVGGGFVIEAHFEKRFSMEALCRLLEGIAQCSGKLGVARFSHEGCMFTLYRSGRIDVRRAESEDEAIRLIDDIKRSSRPRSSNSRYSDFLQIVVIFLSNSFPAGVSSMSLSLFTT